MTGYGLEGVFLLFGDLDYLFNPFFMFMFGALGFFLLFAMTMTMSSELVLYLLRLDWI